MLSSSLTAGWIGGVVGCAVGYPFDTVKTLMQVDPSGCPTTLVTARKVATEEGVRGFFRGCAIPLMGLGVIYAVGFFAYAQADTVFRRLCQGPSSHGGSCSTSDQRLPPRSLHELLEAAAFCGAASGLCMATIQAPAELVKVRQQATLRQSRNGLVGNDGTLFSTVKSIYRENGRGVRNFTTGLGATLARDVPGSALWFVTYEAVRYTCSRDYERPTVTTSLGAGGTAGVVMWTVMMPVDVAKTVQQTTSALPSQGRSSLLSVGRHVFSQRGLRGFYAGAAPAVARAFVANGATFAARDVAERWLR